MRKGHVLLTLFALLLFAANASAQGFGVYEFGTCAMARGGAGVASPCNDGSAIFYNPAGIAFQNGQVVSAGVTVINPRGGFTPSSSGFHGEDLLVKYFPVPSIYYAAPVGKLAVGVGLFAPYGLATEWPLNNTFEGRFLAYKTVLKGIYVQPTVAYKVNDKVAIGGGIDIGYASLELHQRADLAAVPITGTPYTFGMIGVPQYTDFADIKLSGHKYHAGYHIGFQAKVTPVVSIGARYLSRQRFSVNDGVFNSQQIATNQTLKIPLGPYPVGYPIDKMVQPQFATGGSLADGQTVTTSIVYPDQFVVGAAFNAGKSTLLLVDYQFVDWSLFKEIVITRANAETPTTLTENYVNTNGLRIGVEQQLSPALTLRGGFITHGAAAPDETVTPLLPEGKRREFTVGLGAKLSKNFRADFAYQYLHQSDRAGRTIAPAANGTVTNNGVYNFMAHLFGISVVVMF